MINISNKYTIIRKIGLIFLMIVLICFYSYAQKVDTEKIKLPNQFYPIMVWDFFDSGDSLKDIADCNFNLVMIVDPNDIRQVEKLGLKAIMYLEFNIKPDKNNLRLLRNLSDDEIDSNIKRLIQISGKSKAIIGYFLMDEPTDLDYHALGIAVSAVKKYAPGMLAYINLLPNPSNSPLAIKNYTEYLEKFIIDVKPQFIGYDNYTVQFSNDLINKNNTLSYFSNLLEVRKIALKYYLPYWNTVSSSQIYKNKTIPSLPNMLLQAYTSLAAGYGGISWFRYKQKGLNYSPIDKEQNKTSTWYYLKEVNRQISILGPIINQLKSTGVYFTTPPHDTTLPILPGKVIESVQSDGPMMIGEFVNDNGGSYVMIVNLSLDRSVKFSFSSKLAMGDTWIVSPTLDRSQMPIMKKRDINNVDNGYWLTAGEGVLLKIGN